MAHETGKAMKDFPCDVVIASPLKRAMETAQIILSYRENAPEIISDSRIMEVDFGSYEGLCCGEEGFNIPDPDFHLFFDDPEHFKSPAGAETYPELVARTRDFLTDITSNPDYQDKTLFIATHGCALRALLLTIKNLPLKQFWKGGVSENCSVTVVDYQDGNYEIVDEGRIYYQNTDKDKNWS